MEDLRLFQFSVPVGRPQLVLVGQLWRKYKSTVMVAFLEASLIFSITKDTHSDLNAVMRWHKSRLKQIGIMRSYIPLTPNCADDAALLPILEPHPTQAICRCGPFLHSYRTHRGLCLWHARELCENDWSDLDAVWGADSRWPRKLCVRWGPDFTHVVCGGDATVCQISLDTWFLPA